MAKIVYALSGQGRGHTSRVIAVSTELRRRRHEVIFCCGGTAREILEARGERVIPVAPLRQVIQRNRVRVLQTLRCNGRAIRNVSRITAGLARVFSRYQPDLLITDFEAFSPRAAQRLGVPIVSFNHQQVVTETRYASPRRHRIQAALTGLAIRLIAPRRPAHVLITSYFYPPLKHPETTTIVPPIIRPAVQALAPTRGDHVLVYYNHPDGADHVIETLGQVDARFVVYNFGPPAHPERYPNVAFKQPSFDEFMHDLASSRGVLCTAGFTLTSEALYLGKPVLVVPNRGVFEQTINALFLEREGLGMAVIDRPLEARDVRAFLANLTAMEARLQTSRRSGNEVAVDCIERVLFERAPHPPGRPPIPPHPASPINQTAGAR